MRSALDIKAGYFNVPVVSELVRFLGIVTQDALYVFLRMAFGHALAPAHFQTLMNYIMSQARWPVTASVFQDDTTVGDLVQCVAWRDTLEVMK